MTIRNYLKSRVAPILYKVIKGATPISEEEARHLAMYVAAFLTKKGEAIPKSVIVSELGLTPSQWLAASIYAHETKLIMQLGNRRGALYSVVQ